MSNDKVRRNFNRLSTAMLVGAKETVRKHSSFFDYDREALHGSLDRIVDGVSALVDVVGLRIGACALAAAQYAMYGIVDPRSNLTVERLLHKHFATIMSAKVDCPCTGTKLELNYDNARRPDDIYVGRDVFCKNINSNYEYTLSNVVIHLMDNHLWSRRRIAGWVARIENSLGIPQEVKYSHADNLTTDMLTAHKLTQGDEAGAERIEDERKLELYLCYRKADIRAVEEAKALPEDYMAYYDKEGNEVASGNEVYTIYRKSDEVNYAARRLAFTEATIAYLTEKGVTSSDLTYPDDIVADDMILC